MFDKIHIIGGPGSGKSYAANKISKILNIPCFDLDKIFWHTKDRDYTLYAPKTKRNNRLKNIIKKRKWIVEGVFSSWTGISFRKANCIIVLKPYKYLRAIRIVKRYAKGRLKIAPRKIETLTGHIKFLKWNNAWDNKELREIENKLKKYKSKTFYFKNADQAINFIRNMNK